MRIATVTYYDVPGVRRVDRLAGTVGWIGVSAALSGTVSGIVFALDFPLRPPLVAGAGPAGAVAAAPAVADDAHAIV